MKMGKPSYEELEQTMKIGLDLTVSELHFLGWALKFFEIPWHAESADEWARQMGVCAALTWSNLEKKKFAERDFGGVRGVIDMCGDLAGRISDADSDLTNKIFDAEEAG